jgi:hypothetical protein
LGSSEYAAAPAPYPNYVDNSIFYAQLDPYGTWVDVAPFGLCWLPDNVPWGWRPYSYGYWAVTDYGWTWISEEPWGWATYHYGRWLDDADYGWVWVPGNEWAPAWVAWRESDQWVGWAALPPDASWGPDGLSDYDDNSIPADQWCFVRGHRMLNPDVQSSLAPTVRNQALLQHTQDVTRFTMLEGRPVNHGVELAVVQKLAGRAPQKLTITDMPHPEAGHAQEVQGTMVRMFRSTLRPTAGAANGSAPSANAANANPANANAGNANAGKANSANAHAQPRLAPRPPAAAPKPVATPQALEQQRENQAHQAQAALDRERQELAVEQNEELKQAKTAAAQQQILQRQAVERKALEDRNQRQTQLLKAQLQRRFVKAGGDTTKVKPAAKTTLNVKP